MGLVQLMPIRQAVAAVYSVLMDIGRLSLPTKACDTRKHATRISLTLETHDKYGKFRALVMRHFINCNWFREATNNLYLLLEH